MAREDFKRFLLVRGIVRPHPQQQSAVSKMLL
jgi:hypothetical protein